MASLAGGLLSVLGGAAAGGFKGAGDANKENVMMQYDTMKAEALEKAQANRDRINREFQAEEAGKTRALTSEENKLGRDLTSSEAQKTRDLTVSENQLSRTATKELQTELANIQSADRRFAAATSAADRKEAREDRKAAQEKHDALLLKLEKMRQGPKDNRSDQVSKKDELNAKKEITEAWSTGNKDGAKAMADTYGWAIKEEEYTKEKNLLFPDKKGTRMEIVPMQSTGQSGGVNGPSAEKKPSYSVDDMLKDIGGTTRQGSPAAKTQSLLQPSQAPTGQDELVLALQKASGGEDLAAIEERARKLRTENPNATTEELVNIALSESYAGPMM